MTRRHWMLTIALMSVASTCWAQSGAATPLTLAEARRQALANHPRIHAARLRAEAATEVVSETRSTFFPAVSVNVTSVGAQDSTAIAAGALPISGLATRVAAGFVASQLVTDFGRARNLAASASLNATAQEQRVDDTRAAVLLEVSAAYYQALAADAVISVARSDLDAKQLLARQVAALARSDLKSTLDVSFADVAVSEAELVLSRAESAGDGARARLTAALGAAVPASYVLADEPLPVALSADPQHDIDEATASRPVLAALRASRDAALRFATAEKRLALPSVNVLATAGTLPYHDDRLHGSYAAAGINVGVPVLTGGLFAARRTEAALRAEAASKDVDDLTMTVARDVRIAWLEARNAFLRLDVTARLVQQADTTLRLARTRYDAGLTSIVELTQAQLSQTSAHIEAAKAKYEYLDRRALLDYVVGRTQ
jgi:outer membrane protein